MAEAYTKQRARNAVQISNMCVVSEVASSIILLILLLVEMWLGEGRLGEAMLSKGLGAKARITAIHVMLILVAVDLAALMTSHAIIKHIHKKDINTQVEREMPTSGDNEKRTSVNIKLVQVDELHARWRQELWADNGWYLTTVAIVTYGLCTFCGALFIQNFGGCRMDCSKCERPTSCLNRGDDCIWSKLPKHVTPNEGVCSLNNLGGSVGSCKIIFDEESCNNDVWCNWEDDEDNDNDYYDYLNYFDYYLENNFGIDIGGKRCDLFPCWAAKTNFTCVDRRQSECHWEADNETCRLMQCSDAKSEERCAGISWCAWEVHEDGGKCIDNSENMLCIYDGYCSGRSSSIRETSSIYECWAMCKVVARGIVAVDYKNSRHCICQYECTSIGSNEGDYTAVLRSAIPQGVEECE